MRSAERGDRPRTNEGKVFGSSWKASATPGRFSRGKQGVHAHQSSLRLLKGFKTAKDEGIPIPDSKFAELEQDLVGYQKEFDALEVVDIAEADFNVTPPSEGVPPIPANISVVSISGVDQFGSNDREMIPSNVAGLQTARSVQVDVDPVTGEALAPLSHIDLVDTAVAPS